MIRKVNVRGCPPSQMRSNSTGTLCWDSTLGLYSNSTGTLASFFESTLLRAISTVPNRLTAFALRRKPWHQHIFGFPHKTPCYIETSNYLNYLRGVLDETWWLNTHEHTEHMYSFCLRSGLVLLSAQNILILLFFNLMFELIGYLHQILLFLHTLQG